MTTSTLSLTNYVTLGTSTYTAPAGEGFTETFTGIGTVNGSSTVSLHEFVTVGTATFLPTEPAWREDFTHATSLVPGTAQGTGTGTVQLVNYMTLGTSTFTSNPAYWAEEFYGAVIGSGTSTVTSTSTVTATGTATVTSTATVTQTGTATIIPSPDQTTVPPASKIVDGTGNVWTLTTGGTSTQVVENGTTHSETSFVKELAFVSGNVWQENIGNNWYEWLGTGWSAATTTSPLNASGTSTVTSTVTTTQTQTQTATVTSTNTATVTSTVTTGTATVTSTVTATGTATVTQTQTQTQTATVTSTSTVTATVTVTSTGTGTGSGTNTTGTSTNVKTGINTQTAVAGSNTLVAGAGTDTALGGTSVDGGGHVYAGTNTLDLSGYNLTYDSNFSAGISLSANGTTEWISNTDYGGNFGSGNFAQAPDSTAFVTGTAGLTLTAYKTGSTWTEAFIGSEPNGFGQRSGGYFEIMCQLPGDGGLGGGNGTWPSFWLHGDPGANQVEIDVFEYYGFQDGFNTTYHLWSSGGDQLTSFPNGEPSTAIVEFPTNNEGESGLHTYGVLIDQNWTTLFFDRVAMWSVPTLQEFLDQKLSLLVDVCVGGGWPVNVAGPLHMPVTYVRVWQKKGRFNAN